MTDGDMRWKKFCFAIFEMKPELCQGNAEPLFEAAWYYVAFTRDLLQANLCSHLPCFLLYAAGVSTSLLPLHHALMFALQVLILALQAPSGPIALICRFWLRPCRSSVMHLTSICICRLRVV